MSVHVHFIHLDILLVLGELQVGVVGRWSELVARQHKEDECRHLDEQLQTPGQSHILDVRVSLMTINIAVCQ